MEDKFLKFTLGVGILIISLSLTYYFVALAPKKINSTGSVVHQQQTETQSPQTKMKNRYPEEIRKNFIMNCAQTAAYWADAATATTYCNCQLEYVEENYSLSAYLDLEKQFLMTGVLPEAVRTAAAVCSNRLGIQRK